MRYRFALAALLLPLSGCVVPPDQAGYGYGYGYPAPGYPGAYPQPGYPGAYPDYGYPGLTYYGDSPTLAIDGGTVPLIFYGGGWGYYDGGHNWHRAPDGVARGLNQRYPGGAGYHAWSGGQPVHPGAPPGGGFAGRPGGPPPGGPPPGGPPPGGGFPGRPPMIGAPPGGCPSTGTGTTTGRAVTNCSSSQPYRGTRPCPTEKGRAPLTPRPDGVAGTIRPLMSRLRQPRWFVAAVLGVWLLHPGPAAAQTEAGTPPAGPLPIILYPSPTRPAPADRVPAVIPPEPDPGTDDDQTIRYVTVGGIWGFWDRQRHFHRVTARGVRSRPVGYRNATVFRSAGFGHAGIQR